MTGAGPQSPLKPLTQVNFFALGKFLFPGHIRPLPLRRTAQQSEQYTGSFQHDAIPSLKPV
jgi:hypothetical protein